MSRETKEYLVELAVVIPIATVLTVVVSLAILGELGAAVRWLVCR